MKKARTFGAKLSLNRETLRLLNDHEMGEAAGGSLIATIDDSCHFCDSSSPDCTGVTVRRTACSARICA